MGAQPCEQNPEEKTVLLMSRYWKKTFESIFIGPVVKTTLHLGSQESRKELKQVKLKDPLEVIRELSDPKQMGDQNQTQ